jgi:hypothetical protein
MAAFHLSQLPVERQIEHFELYGSKCQDRFLYDHFQIVLQFLAGLVKFAGYPTDRIRSILGHTESSSQLQQITLDGLHWIFEAQGSSSVCEAIGVSIISPVLHYGTLSAFDWFVLGYCVSHISCSWEIKLEGCDAGDEGIKMLVQGSQEGEPSHSGIISVLDLKQNQITGSGLNQLWKSPIVLNLDELDLSYNLLGNGGATGLLQSSIGYSIKHLHLHKTGIGAVDCLTLGKLLSSSPTLKCLMSVITILLL